MWNWNWTFFEVDLFMSFFQRDLRWERISWFLVFLRMSCSRWKYHHGIDFKILVRELSIKIHFFDSWKREKMRNYRWKFNVFFQTKKFLTNLLDDHFQCVFTKFTKNWSFVTKCHYLLSLFLGFEPQNSIFKFSIIFLFFHRTLLKLKFFSPSKIIPKQLNIFTHNFSKMS